MIVFKQLTLQEFIKPYNPSKPQNTLIKDFQKRIETFLSSLIQDSTEENQKNKINALLKEAFGYECNTKGRIDSAIYGDDEISTIIEVKALNNKNEFPKSQDNPLSKGFCESVLYFLRELKKEENNSLKHIILCNPREFFVFDAQDFLIFLKDKKIQKLYKNCDDKEGVETGTERFYKDLESYLNGDFEGVLPYTYFSLHSNLSTEDLSLIYTLLSPQVLLKMKKTLDANTLNKGFYEELLYILGLEEKNEGGKILITPSHTPNSLSYAIKEAYPNLNEEEIFTLITTWNNRILFLRLLESMLISFGHIAKPFLDIEIIKDFQTLGVLFFEVLAKRESARSAFLPKVFASIPYLNSSLFDKIPLESEGKEIKSLHSFPLPLSSKSILKKKGKSEIALLEYLFEFLHAYDFTTTPKDIEEGVKKNHDKLINSAVLGLVFEKLNGYKEGSFYTPSFITSYMCKESITQALIEKFNSTYSWQCKSLEEVREEMGIRGFREHRGEYFQTLLSLKICDPSVGSGHFLVSALNEMIQIAYTLKLIPSLYESTLELENDEILIKTNNELHQYTKPSSPLQISHQIQVELFNLKKSIIENCLFGVDINPNSCEITKLRLWIELLKYSFYLFDEKGENTNCLETLPNIDINIKCGNSLISNFPLDSNLTIGQTKSFANNLKSSIQSYKDSVMLYKEGLGDKGKILQDIQSVKSLIISYLVEQNPANTKLRESLKDFVRDYGDGAFDINTDFGMMMLKLARDRGYKFTPTLTSLEPMPMDRRGEKLLEMIQESYEALENLKSSNAFEWRFEFPEVLDEEGNFKGFDVVIGNPPYIRQELIKELKPTLAKNYEIYKGTSDIYTYFFERGYHLLREGGILSFITSNKWTRAGYGEALRAFILNHTTLQSYIDFNGEKIFESATVDTSITSFLKLSPSREHKVRYLSCTDSSKLQDLEFDSIPQSSLSSEVLVFSSSSVMALREKIESIGTPLKEWDISIFRGVLTGYNEAFIIDTAKREEILNNCKTKEEREATEKIIRKMLRGRDIKRYSYEWADLWIIGTFPSLKLNIEDYPSLKSYLSKFRPRIDQSGEKGCRKKTSNQWFETQDQIAYYEEFEGEKIVYSEIVREPQFFLDTKEIFYAEATSFILVGKNLKYLLGLLNNSFVAYVFKTFYAGGGLGENGYRYKKAFLERLPIPKITESNKPTADKIIALVDEILNIKESNPQADTLSQEKEIDSLVYTLYTLTPEEIAIIEEKK